ncbi:MAG: serine hydrolase domain-containing protein [Pseudomonadota bacterium]
MKDKNNLSRRDFVTAVGATAATVGSLNAPRAKAARLAIDSVSTQELVDAVAKKLGVVGGQLAIFDGNEVHEFSTGFAHLEAKVPVASDTLFQIGSTTKLFNAATVMSLVDEERLDLDEPIGSYLKDFTLPDRAERKITLRHLLSMTSGLDNGPYTDYGCGDDALPLYVKEMENIPRIFEPGEAFGYSNASTNIAGLAAARVVGTNWETLLSDRILAPVGLKHPVSLVADIIMRPFARGYEYVGGASDVVPVTHFDMPRSIAPAGGSLCCNAGDLVRFARMCLDKGANANGTRVLSPDSIATMQTHQVKMPTTEMGVHWCVGPFHKVWDGADIYGHSGTTYCGSSYLLWVPERNFAIATISNVATLGYPFASAIFKHVFKDVLGIEKPKPLNPETAVRADIDPSRYTGKFVSHNRTFTVTSDGQKLNATYYYIDPGIEEETIQSELIPLGGDRFLPAELAMSGNRNWDVAFWGTDKKGAATHFLNGTWPFYRVE